MVKIFQLIPSAIDTSFSSGLHSEQAALIQFVISISLASVILYLTFQGFLVIAGKVQEPIQDVLFKLVSIALVGHILMQILGQKVDIIAMILVQKLKPNIFSILSVDQIIVNSKACGR